MNKAYREWVNYLKNRIRSSQLKAAVSVNVEMILLYWEIGKSIHEKQTINKWGAKIVENLSRDLKMELPDTHGFSRSNLYAMRKFYLFYRDAAFVHQAGGQIQKSENIENTIVHQPGRQLSLETILTRIPWRHHIAILSNCKTTDEAEFYIRQTIANNWSRNVLELQMDSKLIDRKGKALNNFEITLPKPMSDLARETLKDPYKFDFITMENEVQELELEKTT